MNNDQIRVRFAPSPTGYMHVGGLRTALFNWLFAKHTAGVFVLRFEDTDQQRLVEGAAEYIMESLNWLGIEWDEGPQTDGGYGPYVQSERLDIYQKYADKLLSEGKLYRDWTPPEELAQMRKAAQKAKQPFKVDRDKLKTDGDLDQPHVLRLAIDQDFDPSWEDVVYGYQQHSATTLDDYVCIKSDGWPTYNFANVIDDHEMEITHVLRGDEFLSSTPKFLQLYSALGWEPPQFVHVPPVLGPDKAKLSKRHGALGALEYRDLGYPAEGLINFLATLGWNDGTTQELFSMSELIDKFELKRVHKSPAIFDQQRLDWMSGHYLRRTSLDDLAKQAEPFWPQSAQEYSPKYKKDVLSLVHERLKYLSELPDVSWFFFTEPEEYPAKLDMDMAKKFIPEIIDTLEDSDFSLEDLEKRLRGLSDKLDVKTGQMFRIIRIGVTGQTAAPGLFETLHTIGKKGSLRRLQKVLDIA